MASNTAIMTEELAELLKMTFEDGKRHEIVAACWDLDYTTLARLYSMCLILSQSIRQCPNFQRKN